MSEYTDAVRRGLTGLTGVSTGVCPSCEDCWSTHAPDATEAEFAEMCHRGDVPDEASFSHSSCGICGSRLGGDRYVWHWLDDKNRIVHEDDCCPDCVMYIANGDEPDSWG